MPSRRKFDHSDQLALDFSQDANEPKSEAQVANDTRSEVKAKIIPNKIVTPEGDVTREDAFRFFEKWEIPLHEQGRLMGFWRRGPYEDWTERSDEISGEQSDRISILQQIDEYLSDARLFLSHQEAMDWLNKPNKHFDNMSPLDYMATKRSKVLMHVSMRLCLMQMGIKR